MDYFVFEHLHDIFPFRKLSDDDLTALLPALRPELHSCPSGHILARQNTRADRMGLVVSGEVSSQCATVSGNIYVARRFRPGQVYGDNAVYSSPGTWPLSYVTTMESRVLTFLMRGFLEDHAESVPGFDIIYAILVHTMDQANRETIREIARSAPCNRDKILTYFDLMKDKHNGAPFKFRMTREGFAQYLDIGVSSLYREMRELRTEGIVVIDKNNIVTICNERFPEALGQ